MNRINYDYLLNDVTNLLTFVVSFIPFTLLIKMQCDIMTICIECRIGTYFCFSSVHFKVIPSKGLAAIELDTWKTKLFLTFSY